MSKLKIGLLTGAALLGAVVLSVPIAWWWNNTAPEVSATAATATPKKMYPEFYEWEWRFQQCIGTKVFHCDYTSKTCLSGYSINDGLFVGVVLAEDRVTVLAHVVNNSPMWLNVDTGEVRIGNSSPPNQQGYFRYDAEQLSHWRAGEEWGCAVGQQCPKKERKCPNPYEPVPE